MARLRVGVPIEFTYTAPGGEEVAVRLKPVGFIGLIRVQERFAAMPSAGQPMGVRDADKTEALLDEVADLIDWIDADGPDGKPLEMTKENKLLFLQEHIGVLQLVVTELSKRAENWAETKNASGGGPSSSSPTPV